MKMENLKREFKRIRLVHVVIVCAVVFVAFSILGTMLLAAGGLRKSEFSLKDSLLSSAQGKPVAVDEQVEQDLEGLIGIKISTVSDDVFLAGGGDKVRVNLKGECRGAGEPVRLESVFRGGELVVEVKYPRSDRGDWGRRGCSTSLTVTVPDGYRGDFAIATVSGDLYARDLPLVLDEVKLQTVSGDIVFGVASHRELSANTVSGDVGISYAKLADTYVKTVSGDVDITVPAGESFAVEFNSLLGVFESKHPGWPAHGVHRSVRAVRALSGEGGKLLKVSTVSGDCKLR
ncbi:MAG: DUF4097 domain-containing protein [Acidobacteriota bacterium]|jgi:hypothetical protein|nr:DUF4097 domain-containing protein [Acidobacteriota bacterium]